LLTGVQWRGEVLHETTDERNTGLLKATHPAVVASPTDRFDLYFRVIRQFCGTVGEVDTDWLPSADALMNPQGPQMLAATSLVLTKQVLRLASHSPSLKGGPRDLYR
jgi:hypothetical protein